MSVVLIDYNAGNTFSVLCALKRLGVEAVLSSDPEKIQSADKVIFPGVGEAKSAIDFLNTNNLSNVIKNVKQPFLGICLGLQLMCLSSEERDTDCLGVFDVNVNRFKKAKKIPHMGWNNLVEVKGSLFKNITDEDYFYFVHSYAANISTNTIAKCFYEEEFSAALNKDNFYAVQFHPEKSAVAGEKVLKNFLDL